jgi:hypothetical protein
VNTTQKVIAQKMFRLKVLESKGTAFQDLFERIMEKSEVGFKKVKPYGNEGDQKNDGFIPGQGVYFQVYAPEKPEEKDAAAAKKMCRDFEGLFAYWNGKFTVREFGFVFNDSYRGKSPLIYKAAATIQKKHKTIKIHIFCCADLQRIFSALSDEDLLEVIGYVPEENNSEVVDIGVLSEVVSYLIKNEKPIDYENSLTVPDFEEKIKFNNLSIVVAGLLTTASYQAFVLDQFFEQNPGNKDLLQKIFTKFYKESLTEIETINNDEEKNDFVFFKILEKAKGHKSKRVQEAILALMACYFETCDIFEEPKTE